MAAMTVNVVCGDFNRLAF